jgi:hypothetical protein
VNLREQPRDHIELGVGVVAQLLQVRDTRGQGRKETNE